MSTLHWPTGKTQTEGLLSPHQNISFLSTNVDSQSVSQLVTIVPIHLGSLKVCNKSKLSQRFLLKYGGLVQQHIISMNVELINYLNKI